MRDKSGGHRVEVDLRVDPQATDAKPEYEMPFRIALFGNFSGHAHRDSKRNPVSVDRDRLDDVIAELRPELRIPLRHDGDHVLQIQFSSLEDFHPDRLYERVSLFDGVRELRRELAATPARPEKQSNVPRHQTPIASSGNLLDDIVTQSSSSDSAAAGSPLQGGDLQTYLNRIVAPHLVPPDDPRRQALLAEVESVAVDGLRALLNHPEFQALEAAWRGVHLLTHAIESDADLQLYLFDMTRAELPELNQLVTEYLLSPRREWRVLAGLYSFGLDPADLELLRQLGTVASRAQALWLSAADPQLVGCSSLHATPDPDDWVATPDPAWQALRRSLQAPWIGLVMPRFLLREPYYEGSGNDSLWGNPVLACLLMLVQAVAQTGRPHPGMDLEIEARSEALLGERAAERILDRGLMPLVSIRDAGRVRLIRFQSIADPATPLGNLLGPASPF